MILALGIGSYIGGLFHLITHAFFKALLFLGSGSVIHAAHHEQELPQYGGLWRKIPITAITFGIAVLAIAGTPFLSGFYSKDMILAHAGAFASLATASGRSGWYWLLFWLPVGIAFVTPFYMMRCWMLTFWGRPRNQHLYDHAHEAPLLYIPLILLAIPSVIAGRYMMLQELIESSMREQSKIVLHTRNVSETSEQYKTYDLYSQAWPAKPGGNHLGPPAGGESDKKDALTHSGEALEHGEHLVHTWVFWAFLVGLGVGFAIYFNGYAVANILMAIPPLRWIHTWLYRRMYFDELYMAVFVAITMTLARLSAAFDRIFVDGLVNFAAHFVKRSSDVAGLNDKYIVDGAVNGLASATESLGTAVRAPQSGRIRMYVTVLLGAIVIGIAAAIVVVISK
jgi:NADH:ubiquinone oxidoreductase subunit 5 (subunit L)/multisubunit Na+/H+ antiporter MnhA subunit